MQQGNIRRLSFTTSKIPNKIYVIISREYLVKKVNNPTHKSLMLIEIWPSGTFLLM